jgi:hypothetical protein
LENGDGERRVCVVASCSSGVLGSGAKSSKRSACSWDDGGLAGTVVSNPSVPAPIPGVMRRWGVWWGVVGSLVKVIGWWRFGLVTIVARRMVSVGVAAVVRVGMVA